MKLVIIENKKFLINEDKDFHSNYGVIKRGDLKKGITKTHLGHKAIILDPVLSDYIELMPRGPAIVKPFDIGLLIGITSLNKDSIVIEGGTGSGASAIMFSSIVKKVYSYEVRKDFFRVAKRNIDSLNIKNIVLKNEDIRKNKVKEADVFFLDLPEPWLAIETAYKSLKKSGFLVAYTPQITQAQRLVLEATKDNRFLHELTIQPNNIEWIISEKILRPRHFQRCFTAFFSFLRKI